jgi:hypothetical protein
MTHLSDDKTVAKMGHPVVVVRLDVGHPSGGGKVGFTAVTTEGDEVVVAFSLESLEA